MEIERKFRVERVPEGFGAYPQKVIEQGYLCKKPTVRIRKSDEAYLLTLKDKHGVDSQEEKEAGIISREIEIPLSSEAYEHLKDKIDGFVVEKTRHLIPLYDGLTAEVDVFRGRLAGLMVAEVEFPDVETSKAFIPPSWMGEDVSADERFRNSTLSDVEQYVEEIFA